MQSLASQLLPQAATPQLYDLAPHRLRAARRKAWGWQGNMGLQQTVEVHVVICKKGLSGEVRMASGSNLAQTLLVSFVFPSKTSQKSLQVHPNPLLKC